MPETRKRNLARWLASALAICLLARPVTGQERQEAPDPEAFRDPPEAARPRVWWHWLNGNISKDGIRKDLEWMKRTGIGGVQTFDINFQTPDVLSHRLIYMTPEWKDAFRFAAQETDRLGLELTIASSPGWSLTGGPWVKPENAMKKLVWSEAVVRGGSRVPIKLASPPSVSGSYQDIPLTPEPGADPKHVTPAVYADVAVLAYRASRTAALPIPGYRSGETALDGKVLTDGSFIGGITIKRDSANGATIEMAYDRPQTVRSLSMFLPGIGDMFNGATVRAELEASQDGRDWRQVAKFTPTLVPSTVGLAPITARKFRVRLLSVDGPPLIDTISAPGYAGVNYAQFLRLKPIEVAELKLSADPKVDQFQAKSGFAVAPDYYALDAKEDASEAGVAASAVVDLTARLRPDGTLDWTPPAGDWRVIRMGWSLTGKTNHPAPAEATGLEVDKLDGAAVEAYMRQYVENYRSAVGSDLLGARGINAVLTDSTEVGSFNWTPKLPEAFKRIRGYDLTPWLPALTGVIVGTRADTDRFLYDFRMTIAQLHASEHYGAVARVAHANGLKVYGEALEGWRVSLGDDIAMRGFTDVPMAAMWTFPREIGPRPLLLADLRTAASSAHLRGLPVVAAESMTSSRFPWAHAPADLRRIVDTEFANGINRIVIHTSPHQPVDDKQPGLSLRHIGQFFTRHETWATMARPWIDYLSRTSYLLQQGHFVAEVAYFVGEDAPAGTLATEGRLSDLPRRYGFDLVNSATILDDFAVKDGVLATKSGAAYRVLFLSGTSDRMTLPVLRRIAQLAQEGAVIVGRAPKSTPSLADDPRAFDDLVRKLWSGGDATVVGRGRVIAMTDVEAALASIAVGPDFQAKAADMPSLPAMDFVHRQSDAADIYFVRNGSTQPVDFEADFRVAGRMPEIWDAVSGNVQPVSYSAGNGRTRVPLSIPPEETRFVVFRKPATQSAVTIEEPRPVKLATIEGGWSVPFQAGRGAPASILLPKLQPLNENADPGVKFFSGIASYAATFKAPAGGRASQPLLLDLGTVGDIAEVKVNGQSVGTAWAAPYRMDISRFVKRGANRLEIRVANLWVNRLIGDAQPGATKIGWTAAPMYKADAPLRPSGLIGPVTVLSTETAGK